MAPINTVETNRMKEKIKMELNVSKKSASMDRLKTAQSELMESRRTSLSRLADTPAPVFQANDMRTRKFRPTASAAIGARHNNHYASLYNSNNYLPPLQGMPAAYLNPHGHAPLILGTTAPGFFRTQGSMNGNPY
jgi:hypothetical protein